MTARADFRIEVTPDRESVFLSLAGELDLATAPALAEEIAELRARGFARVVLDLRALEFMDSTGLSLICGELERSGPGAFAVVPGTGEPRRLLELSCVLGELSLVRERDAPPRLTA
jgi:anti-sigma B factor antagonist